jgi:hypothetical protein
MQFNPYIRPLLKLVMNKTYIKTNLTAFSMAGLFCFFISSAIGQERTFDVTNGNVSPQPVETVDSESKSNKTDVSKMEYSSVDLIESDTKKNTKQVVHKNTPAKIEEQQINKETTSAKTKTVTPDESVLSFNFLYYIIQKFKFNDVNVIDQ